MLAGIFGLFGLIAMCIYFPRKLYQASKNRSNKAGEIKKWLKYWALAFFAWLVIGMVLAGVSGNKENQTTATQDTVKPSEQVKPMESAPVAKSETKKDEVKKSETVHSKSKKDGVEEKIKEWDPEQTSKVMLITKCELAIKPQLKNPSSMDVDFGMSEYGNVKGNPSVILYYYAENGFGATPLNKAGCIFDKNGNLTDIKQLER